MRRHTRVPGSFTVLLLMLTVGCGEYGLPLPRDPGNIRISVRDEQGSPVANAGISIQSTNESGGVYWMGLSTGPDGIRTAFGISAGPHPVSVTPPAGYSAGADALTRVIEVVKGETVDADFVVRHGPSS